MTATTKVPMGASTVNRKWYVDVDISATSTPNWIPVMAITDFQPSQDDNLEDDSDFDSGGYQSDTKTAEKWSLVMTVARKTTVADATVYDPGQEFLRLKSEGNMAAAATAHMRWYEMSAGGPRTQAYEGRGTVSWAPQGGAMTALDTAQVTVSGQGKRTAITHPDSGSAAVPVVASVSPLTLAVAGSDLVTLTGSGFTGATSVKFATTSVGAGDYTVLSDYQIVCVAPAHAAGAVNVTVVTPAGTSATSSANSVTYA